MLHGHMFALGKVAVDCTWALVTALPHVRAGLKCEQYNPEKSRRCWGSFVRLTGARSILARVQHTECLASAHLAGLQPLSVLPLLEEVQRPLACTPLAAACLVVPVFVRANLVWCYWIPLLTVNPAQGTNIRNPGQTNADGLLLSGIGERHT